MNTMMTKYSSTSVKVSRWFANIESIRYRQFVAAGKK